MSGCEVDKNDHVCDHKHDKALPKRMIAKKEKAIDKVEKGMKLMLEGLKEEFNLDITDHNFHDTPVRVARSYAEIFSGIMPMEEIQKQILSASFESNYSGIVLIDNIQCYGMCPHHFLPVEYKVDVAYIGEKKVGLSKIPRIVEILAKRPVLQETFTQDIVDSLKAIDPSGVFVRVKGKHFCMAMRGVKQGGCWTYTSAVSGKFQDQPSTKDEVLSMMQDNKR